MGRLGEGLGEYVGDVVGGPDFVDGDESILDLLANVVIPHVDVLR